MTSSAAAAVSPSSRGLSTILLLGDVMLGRLIDQLLPTHVDAPEDAAHIRHFLSRHPKHLFLQGGASTSTSTSTSSHGSGSGYNYSYASPWGTTLPLLQASDLVIANLETAVTTHGTKWPDKAFNYRSHPANVRCLTVAGIGCVSLANNHTLDFGRAGLLETVRAVECVGITCVGAGEGREAAERGFRLGFGLKTKAEGEGKEVEVEVEEERDWEVRVWAFSDHPREWSAVEGFNWIGYDEESRARMKRILTTEGSNDDKRSAGSSLKVVSVHWGPNYQWQPAREIRELAHWLVDECEVDLIHGHSSHHIQGVEVYKGSLIVYGCGDFVDDYAVHAQYRNDLSAAWKVNVGEADGGGRGGGGGRLKVVKLEVFPNRIKHFQAGLLGEDDEDHKWVKRKFKDLCSDLGTRVEADLGPEGQIVVEMKAQGRDR